MPLLNLDNRAVILFQGDSITDAGRSRISQGPNSLEGMGYGYPRMIMDHLLDEYPDQHLQFINRGVSGNRIQDLAGRWPHDALHLNPDLVSILIGINDSSTYLYMGMGSSPEDFRRIYGEIIRITLEALPGITLVLCEPFALFPGEVNADWEEDLSSRQDHVRELAEEYQAIFIPFQTALDKAVKKGVPPTQLLEDGVHPTVRGHRLLADCWIENVKKG